MNHKSLIKKTIKKPAIMFLLGMAFSLFLVSIIIPNQNSFNNETILESSVISFLNPIPRSTEIPLQTANNKDKPSPNSFFDETQIRVFKDRVVLEADNILWAGFTDTKSMLPVINKDSNALQITPNCPEDINIGDIISYKSKYADGIIIHRVVHVDEDDDGVYFVLKGDNNPSNDPGRIRCDQIDRKVVAIIY